MTYASSVNAIVDQAKQAFAGKVIGRYVSQESVAQLRVLIDQAESQLTHKDKYYLQESFNGTVSLPEQQEVRLALDVHSIAIGGPVSDSDIAVLRENIHKEHVFVVPTRVSWGPEGVQLVDVIVGLRDRNGRSGSATIVIHPVGDEKATFAMSKDEAAATSPS